MLAPPCRSPMEDKVYMPAATRIALVIEYDGTDYFGFQWQDDQPTIQQELEEAIFRLTGEKTRVVSASRTDTGVHAQGQVVSFRAMSSLPLSSFVTGLNYYLPSSIAVKTAHRPAVGFHVQRSAVSREYEYYLLNRPTRSPLWQRFAYRVPGNLDLAKMREACQTLVGEHDFASFTNAGCPQLKDSVRKVYKAELRQDDDLVVFTIVASSFLTHQVRNTVGALLKVGLGRMSTQAFYSIMEQKKPGLAGPKAPACGLHLIRVNYPHPIEEETDENV